MLSSHGVAPKREVGDDNLRRPSESPAMPESGTVGRWRNRTVHCLAGGERLREGGGETQPLYTLDVIGWLRSLQREEGRVPEESRNHAIEILLDRVLELHGAGRTPHDIATLILTTDPETAMFRAAMLVEVIIGCACRYGNGRGELESRC